MGAERPSYASGVPGAAIRRMVLCTHLAAPPRNQVWWVAPTLRLPHSAGLYEHPRANSSRRVRRDRRAGGASKARSRSAGFRGPTGATAPPHRPPQRRYDCRWRDGPSARYGRDKARRSTGRSPPRASAIARRRVCLTVCLVGWRTP